MKRTLLLSVLLACVGTVSDAQQLAFPGAQGWGRYATGGREGTVYHVTNLNDSGTGSLRDAVSESNRIVVFDVSGVINITSRIVFESDLYVAGQTAPGEGIIVYGDGVSFSGADNIIVRYIRFRMGKDGTSGKDCAGVANGENMIFDHCSFSWGLDEVFSINPDGKGTTPQNITLSNCIFGQGLLDHSAGGLIQSDSITLYRNLYCDNSTRNNKVKGCVQYVNNMVYNWKSGCFLMGGDSSGSSYVNLTNNMFINGPSGTGNAITSGNSDFHVYATDNWQDRDQDGTYDPYEIPEDEYSGGPTFEDEPFDYPELDAWDANDLVDSLLPDVGASLPYRDYADFYMYYQVLSFGTSGALISSEEQLPFGNPTTWDVQSFDAPTDSDGDGMPDDWETENGTNPDSDDAMDIASNGYANIENYINSISKDNITLYLRAPMMVEDTDNEPESITIGWADYTEGEDGFIIEMLVDDSYDEVARIEAGAQEYTVTGLEPGTAYSFRIRAYKGEEYSEYAELDAKTTPEEVEMVDCDSFVGDDDNWLIEVEAGNTETVTITDTVTKNAIVVRGDGDAIITGDGTISGTGSLNKTGAGTLTVETTNDYTGQTVLHNGTFSFSSLKDGGEESSLGASYEYSQNWIWDGGIWNYTGSSTSTNRNAMLYDDTEFNIANDVTVEMTGYIEGDGDITISGNGTIEPESPEFFAFNGNTILKDGGTLNLTLDYNNGIETKQVYLDDEEDDTQALVLAGGNFSSTAESGAYPTFHFPIQVEDGTYSTFTVSKNAYINCDVTGTGTLEFQIQYVREYLEGDWTEFYGTLVANGVGTESDGSQLLFQKGFDGMPNTKVYLKGNARVVCWNTNDEQYIGGLSGEDGTYLSASSKNTTGAEMIWHIGGLNSDEEFFGVIDNQTSAGKTATTYIVKEGSGDWRLSGTNVYSGTTKVNGGALIVNGKNNGTGAYTVYGGATLAGTGSIAGAVTIEDEAYIQAGDTLIDGSELTLTSSLTVEAGGTISIPADKLYCNSLNVSGTVTLEEGAVLELAGGEFEEAPYDDTAYQIFSSSSIDIDGTFAEIIPSTPGDGQSWDTSDLYTDGILRVVGGETNPDADSDDDSTTAGTDDEDVDTLHALLCWGNMTASSYDDSDYNNQLIGNEGDAAEGFTLVLTGNLEKSYTSAQKITLEYEGETIERTTIKLSNGAQNSLFLPSGAKATLITLWSYTNLDEANRTNYWKEVAGTEYSADEATILTCYKNYDNPDCVSFTLDNVEDVITFTNTGEQQCVVIYVEYNYNTASGIDSYSATAGQPVTIEYYTVSGIRVETPSKGLYIMRAKTADGKVYSRKVVL